jgi:beta-glucosidase
VGTHADSRYGPLGLFQGDYQGSSWRDGEPNTPLFPFGFGLSFGVDQFKFFSGNLTSPLSAKSFEVKIALSAEAVHTSDPGGAVVQLYFSQRLAQAVRPRLMLLAFSKVQRGATEVTLTVPTNDLGYWHPLSKSTSVDTGTYTLSVGTSSATLHDTTTLTIQ